MKHGTLVAASLILITMCDASVVRAAAAPAPVPSPCGTSSTGMTPPTLPQGVPTALPTTIPFPATMPKNISTTASTQGAPASPPPLPKATSMPADCGTAPPGGSMQQRIGDAAKAFVGTITCGLHGAPGSEACMASVNQILINAGVAPLGPGPFGSNYIPTAVASGRMQPIPQSATVPGDLVVTRSRDDSDEHIGVCETYGCTDVLSNASHDCTFGWESGPDMLYAGSPFFGGSSTFYRVLP